MESGVPASRTSVTGRGRLDWEREELSQSGGGECRSRRMGREGHRNSCREKEMRKRWER